MKIRNIVWFGALIISFCLCTDGAIRLKSAYPSTSLRFENEFSSNAMIKYAQSDKNKTDLYPTLWKQKNGIATANSKEQGITKISVLGNGFLCYPMVFINGGYGTSSMVCTISSQLAFKLFNSVDIVGLPLKINETTYNISGVFKANADIVLHSALATDTFENVEITANISDAKSFITSAGLSMPKYIIDYEVINILADFLFCIPIIFATMLILTSFYKASHYKEAFAFTALIIAACTVPFFLHALPSFLLPSKWSDFSFYHKLFQSAAQALHQWFILIPTAKDITAKYALMQCISTSVISIALIKALLTNRATC